MSQEQKDKIAKAHLGTKKPWSGKYMTEAHKKAISEREMGNTHCKGRKLSKETIEKIRLSNLGKKHNISEEGRARMRIKGYDVWNKGMLGYNAAEKNARWISDRTKLAKSDRQAGSAYSNWRMSVYKRDGFLCKMKNHTCSGKIEAHHIRTWKKYPELRYDVSNGITLCVKHHPRKRSDEENLESYFLSLLS